MNIHHWSWRKISNMDPKWNMGELMSLLEEALGDPSPILPTVKRGYLESFYIEY